MADSTLPGGIYVHIPFCVRKCHYCDFYSTTDLDLIPQYLESLEAEIQMVPPAGLEFDAIYLGGGTPSVLTPAQSERVLEKIFGRFAFGNDVEVNIEVNPGTVDRNKLADYRAAGFNRLTVGVQSFDDRNLRLLGRIHTAEAAEQTIAWARTAGFDHLGLDLIYALPGQSREDWIEDMRTAVSFHPGHLSCYMLTVEAGTPLHADVRCGRVSALDEKTGAQLFKTTVDFLAGHGFCQYEVSNFAYSDHSSDISNRSRHNQKYWTFAPYIGFGPGAHSFLEPRRYWNHRNLQAYLTDTGAGRPPIVESEELTKPQMIVEAILLGLRQSDGIDLVAFKDKFEIDFERHFSVQIEQLLAEGRAEIKDSRLALSTEGLLLLDSICARLIMELDE